MPEPSVDQPAGFRHPRWLYYLIATLLVAFVLKAGFPEAMCGYADDFRLGIQAVDPFFVTDTFVKEYKRLNRERMDDVAEHGGPASMHPSFVGIVLKALFTALGATLASGGWTIAVTALSLGLGILLLWRLQLHAGPYTPIAVLFLAAGIAFVLCYVTAFVFYLVGCNGPLFVLAMTIWPFVTFALSVRDTAGTIEKMVERRDKPPQAS